MEWYVTLSFRLSPDDNRGAWRNLLEVVIADSWLLERGIPRLATLARNDDGIMSSRAKSRDPFFFVLHSLKMTIRGVSKKVEKDYFPILTSGYWLLITKGFLDSSLRSSLGMTSEGARNDSKGEGIPPRLSAYARSE